MSQTPNPMATPTSAGTSQGVMTQSAANLALAHILVNILGCSNQSEITLCLKYEGIEDVLDLYNMTDYMIENLEYHPDLSGSPIPLPKRYKQKIRQVVKWTKYINQNYGADTNWTTLTPDDFT